MENTYAKNRDEWRLWLKESHKSEKEIWLVYYKKHTGKPSISYRDSVEEAICFGWIDGIKKKIDDESYAHRFSPRNKKSKWSSLNIKLAKEAIKEDRMTESGIAAFKERKIYADKFQKLKEITLTSEIEEALKGNKIAWENYNKLAPGYKKQYAGWLVSAKKEETRGRRLKEAIKLLENNQKLGMK